MAFTSPLNSSASPLSSFWHTSSMVVTQSMVGGLLDVKAKLGLWVNKLLSACDSGWLERLTTHLSFVLEPWFSGWSGSLTIWSCWSSDIWGFLARLFTFRSCPPVPPWWMFGRPPLFFWHNHSSLAICLCLTYDKGVSESLKKICGWHGV